ncbi:MAG TPA: NifU family protein [Candidatus Kapabacteria bacterium]|jgi:Fe-S cluster biogenesis protein NfuA
MIHSFKNGHSGNGHAEEQSRHDHADLETRVRQAIEHVKPFLMVDGGSVELVGIDYTTWVVEVCLVGACRTCSLAAMTLRAGIERAIMHDAPEIRRVEAVSNPELEYNFENHHPVLIDFSS